MNDHERTRGTRSYVLRQGRMTAAQRRALETLLPTRAWPATPVAPRAVTGRDAPLNLEIGTGDGENILAQAAARPHEDFIACEVHGPGIGHLLLKAESLGLRNLWVAQRDAHELLSLLPAGSLTELCLFFPDPWPKTRHHKRRIFQRPLLDAARIALARHGRLRVASDIEAYADWVLEQLALAPEWLNLAGPARCAPRLRARVLTRFEARARRDGRRVYDFALTPRCG